MSLPRTVFFFSALGEPGSEVKRSKIVSRKDIRPLLAFLEDYPQAKACLLHGGRERLNISGVPCLPCDEFLRNLLPNKPAPT